MRSDRSDVSFEESLRFVAAAVASARHTLERPTVMVSSAAVGEGKTTVCVGLARTLAGAGHRTVLVDLNFRHPTAHALVGGTNEVGTADVLAGRKSLDEAVQQVSAGEARLTLVAAGSGDPDPALLLMEDRLADVLNAASEAADLVLVDAPALLPFAEPLTIGSVCGAAILVAEARRRALPRLERARDLLARSRTEVLGVVLDDKG